MAVVALDKLFLFLILQVATLSQIAYSNDGPALDQLYQKMIQEEYQKRNTESLNEQLASGAAAVIIGLYGYYNTSPDPLVKFLFAATQTAGVLTIGYAIKEKNNPRLNLELDRLIGDASDQEVYVEKSRIRQLLLEHKLKSEKAETKTTAYTSLVLASLYAYNALQERSSDKTLRNVYYFLSFNFAVAAGLSFYRILSDRSGHSSVVLSLSPYPTWTYVF